jgi:tRNA G18 (ribose-2'-O)-methylase SpoU
VLRAERLDTSDPAWVQDPRLEGYRVLRDPELVRRGARFVAEGRRVVRTLLADSSLRALSVLAEEPAFEALQAGTGGAREVPAYVVPSGALRTLAGWHFHQGCLALGERPAARPLEALLDERPSARLLVGLEVVSNPDNVGAIFRSALALGASGVVLAPGCASPLYRKALRTSLGAALRLPFADGTSWEGALDLLARRGWALLALTPSAAGAVAPEEAAARVRGRPRALLLGAEGDGLGAHTLARADLRVRIPLHAEVDSLNVAAAAAVALHVLRPEGGVP